MFNFYFGGRLSSVTPRSLRRLHWMLIPGFLCPNSYGLAQVKRIRDLGSVSTGYSDRPWDPGKQLPLGLSLTGPALRRRVSSAIALELVRRKLQERKKIYE